MPCSTLLAPKSVYPAEEWQVLRHKLIAGKLRGNLVTDAWIAAAVLQHSESLAMFDTDFQRLLPAHALTVLGP